MTPSANGTPNSTALRRLRTVAVALAATIALATPDALAQEKRNSPKQLNVVPITITNVVVQGGGLVAHGIAGTAPFTAPLTMTALNDVTVAATCPILNLQLGPIHVDVLGLNIDTSQICLDVTAIQGGGLLGDLLCGIANLLAGGTPLSTVLGGLNAEQTARLDRGLTSLLNQAVFIPLGSSEAFNNATCEILSLSIGPLDLNLLGLRVELDNCANPPGPITLDITADPGGGLLGDLLCNLANLLNTGNSNAILRALREIANLIGQILS